MPAKTGESNLPQQIVLSKQPSNTIISQQPPKTNVLKLNSQTTSLKLENTSVTPSSRPIQLRKLIRPHDPESTNSKMPTKVETSHSKLSLPPKHRDLTVVLQPSTGTVKRRRVESNLRTSSVSNTTVGASSKLRIITRDGVVGAKESTPKLTPKRALKVEKRPHPRTYTVLL